MQEETINQMIDAGSAGILARPILIQSKSAVKLYGQPAALPVARLS